MTANYDPTACFDATTNQPLEGTPRAPTVPVELDPADVAAGRDTVIERAVKELGFFPSGIRGAKRPFTHHTMRT